MKRRRGAASRDPKNSTRTHDYLVVVRGSAYYLHGQLSDQVVDRPTRGDEASGFRVVRVRR